MQRVTSQINALKRDMHGHSNQLRGVKTAPPVTLRPWYQLVVAHTLPDASVEYALSPQDICTYLLNQLGLATQDFSKINIKLKRVDLYGAPTGSSADRPSVSLVVSSTMPSVGDPTTPGNAEVWYSVLKTIQDNGNLSEVAKASFTYPRAMADLPLSSQSRFTVVQASSNVAFASLRFHVEWCSTDVAPPQ